MTSGLEQPSVLSGAVTAMCRAQRHRGPDDQGLHVSPGRRCAIGSNRLAVLDLTAAGHQPMCNEDETYWVVYNGEVYNFQELRKELVAAGHHFRSRTDTEAVLHLFEDRADECVDRLRGMFAFAIWDERRHRLFLARDRFGQKPLYYAWDGRTFVFASEMKAIAASGRVSLTLDPAAVVAYLTLGSIPPPLTIYREVKALEPGHVMSLDDGEVIKRRYWHLDFSPDLERDPVTERERLQALLAESVALRLISDVPVGVFLSGGVDSSALVALMRQAGHDRVRTFSIGFDESAYSEATQGRRVAKRFGTEHTESVVRADEVLHDIDRIVWALDQPTIDGINTYYVSRLAHQAGVVVALSGVGADEVFFGYSTFRSIPRWNRWSRLIRALPAGPWLARWGLGWTTRRNEHKLRLLLADTSVAGTYLAMRGLFVGSELAELVDPDFLEDGMKEFDPIDYARQFVTGGPGSMPNDVCRLELGTYMANQLLHDTDLASMAHSLEVRAPYIDHKLVEFMARLPVARKVGQRPKALLVDAVGRLLPREVVARPKRGFTFPFNSWFRSEWRDFIEETLFDNGTGALPFLNRERVREVWSQFESGRSHWSRVWALVALARWTAVGQPPASRGL